MSRHVETATLYGKYHGKLALRQDVFYITFRADGDSWPYQYYHTSWGFCHIYNIFIYIYNWLVISTPLKTISQFGWLFPIYGKNKKCSKPPTSIKIAKSQKKQHVVYSCCCPHRIAGNANGNTSIVPWPPLAPLLSPRHTGDSWPPKEESPSWNPQKTSWFLHWNE